MVSRIKVRRSFEEPDIRSIIKHLIRCLALKGRGETDMFVPPRRSLSNESGEIHKTHVIIAHSNATRAKCWDGHVAFDRD